MKLLPKTRTEWQKAALFTASAPLVIVTVANLAAFLAYENAKVLTQSWFVIDGILQSIQTVPYRMIRGVSEIGTLILSLVLLFVNRNLAALGLLVLIVFVFITFMTPMIIHE